MPPVETLLSFLIATAAFAYMPGPAMLYTATQTLARGRQAGWMAAAGIHIGGYVHVIAAAAGLSVLFTTLPTLYWAVKILGAAYLVWLGVKLFLSGTKKSDTPIFTLSKDAVSKDGVSIDVVSLDGARQVALQTTRQTVSQATKSATTNTTTAVVFRDSALVEILNPKTAIFYLAFLPQFTEVSAALPIWGQLLILGTFVNIAFSSADILCVLLASRVANTLNQTSTGQRIVQVAGGCLFVGLGIHLLIHQT